MKPLLLVALCFAAAIASPDNIEQVKELPQSKEPLIEAEESQPQTRKERCLTCSSSGSFSLGLNSPHQVLAKLQSIPGAEVHTQQSFEECSSEKGCAGIQVKDGQVIQKFGNFDAFKAAAAADTGNEFQFHAAGSDVFANGGPFWWMNQDSPFKAATAGAGGAGSFKKFSESSSFSSSAGAGGAGAGAGGPGAGFNLAANPFLNGEFSKVASGFAAGQEIKPQTFQSSSFESSSFSTSAKGGEVDISKNPFLNGGFKNGGASSGYQSSSSFSGQNQAGGAGFNAGGSGASNFAGGKFTGYTGSSPSPFTASTSGSNVNLIQGSQKANEFDFEQQQQTQQNIDEIFQGTGNVVAHEHSGGELQQTCAGQGYVCVHKAQCNNGVVNTNGAGLLQAKTKKQYCNTKNEICCRIEISTLNGAGGLQGSLGVGSATFQGAQGSSSGGGLFASGSQGSAQGGSAFGQAGQSSSGQGSQAGQGGFTSQGGIAGQAGQSAFGSSSSSFGSSSFGSRGSSGSAGAGGSGFGAQGSQGSQSSQGATGFGATASGSSFGANNGGAFGANGVNRGVTTIETSSFESTNTQRGASGGFGAGNGVQSGVGSGVSKFGATGSGSSFGSNSNGVNGFGTTQSGGTGSSVYKTTSQTNFIETDSFSAGTENQGVFRGNGLKPGIPYLPPVDNTNSASGVSQTSFSTVSTARPYSPKPAYIPPVTSTAAPGYLPPEVPEQTVNTETRVPQPQQPTYTEGGILLDANRQPNRKPVGPGGPINNEIPAGCAAALKCTPIEYCTAEGVISNTTVALSRDQDAFRVPLTDCKDLETGRVGKCCRDPFYTDPWPTNQLGKWVQGVFGGNDGKYTPDSRGSPSISRPLVTARPAVTGSTFLNNFRTSTPKPAVTPFGPNQVTPGFGATTSQSAFSKGQYEVRGQGQFAQGGQGQYSKGGQGQFSQGGQGQFSQGGQGQFTQGGQGQFTQGGQGQYSQGGQGQYTKGGQGQYSQGGQGVVGVGQQGAQGQVSQGQSSFSSTQSQFSTGSSFLGANQGAGVVGQGGQGQLVSQGQGQLVSQGQGQLVSQGQGQLVSQGQGQLVSQGQGQLVSQGQGQTVSKGQGQIVSQGQGSYVQQGGGSFAQGGRGQYSQGGRGQYAQGGVGQLEIQGQGAQGSQGQFSSTQKGFGQTVITGEGVGVSQGFGSGVRQGAGFGVSQGAGLQVENEYSESTQRVFLSQYQTGGQCGIFNGQKPFGNRNENEVDFAEIPWQAMILLQTNRSLLCGGVITRPDVVVTSAACVDGLDAKNVLIKGGEWKLGIDDEPLPFQIVQVKNILRHPFYKRGSLHFDVAILVLAENLRFNKNIYPICLPRAGETLDAFYNGAGECIVTGWGKQVLQAHIAGAIMHSVNVSLINPGECQAKLSADYPHLLEQYDQESCACGQPTNPVNNICTVDIGSALACTTDSVHWVLRGVYSWDSGCQPGNQLAAFYKFDLEWYEWAIGLVESARFAQFGAGAVGQQIRGQVVKGGSGVKGGFTKGGSAFGSQGFGAQGFSQGYSQFSSQSTAGFGQVKPVSNSYSASYSEKKTFQSEPKIITYTTKPEIVTFTTKPEIVTFTTKPEYFTYTTKPKIVTFTTKPQIIRYETSGSGNNPQYIAPGVTFNPSFKDVVGSASHKHSATCQCEGK